MVRCQRWSILILLEMVALSFLCCSSFNNRKFFVLTPSKKDFIGKLQLGNLVFTQKEIEISIATHMKKLLSLKAVVTVYVYFCYEKSKECDPVFMSSIQLGQDDKMSQAGCPDQRTLLTSVACTAQRLQDQTSSIDGSNRAVACCLSHAQQKIDRSISDKSRANSRHGLWQKHGKPMKTGKHSAAQMFNYSCDLEQAQAWKRWQLSAGFILPIWCKSNGVSRTDLDLT